MTACPRPLRALAPLLLVLSTPAWAGQVLVPPVISNGVDPIVAGNITGMIASELDFMSQFEGSKSLKAPPAGWNAKCLSSGACMGAIQKANGTTALISGQVTPKGSKVDLQLVYAEGTRIVNSKVFTVANIPSVIADGMAGMVKEVVTGQSASAAAAAAAGPSEDQFADSEDDFEVVGVSRRVPTGGAAAGRGLEDELDEDDLAAQEAERERAAAAASAAAAARKREEQARAAEQARLAEQERQRAAAAAAAAAAQRQREEEQRRAAAAAAAKPKPKPAPVEEEELSFGGGVVAPSEEEEDARPVVAARPPARTYEEEEDERLPVAAARAPAQKPRPVDDFEEDEPRPRPAPVSRYDDLDEPQSRSKSSSSSKSSSNKPSSSSRSVAQKKGEPERSAGITGRVGYAKLAEYNFLTYGAEVTFMPTGSFGIIGGIEAYSARRATTVEEQEQLGAPPIIWQSVVPINFGAVYKYTPNNIRPYIGGDVQLITGLVRGEGGVATGFRFRGGSDFMVTDIFGFNLNLALGFAGGKALGEVSSSTSAITPAFSAGTTLVF